MDIGDEQAFPIAEGIEGVTASGTHWTRKMEVSHGLTKREWLAGLAMQGLLAMFADPEIDHRPSADWAAKAAIGYADALLAELEKPHG